MTLVILEKIFLYIFMRIFIFEFLQFSRKKISSLSRSIYDVKLSSKRTHDTHTHTHTHRVNRFKMRSSGSLYDSFLRSYISLNYGQFFIVIDAIMLFTVDGC